MIINILNCKIKYSMMLKYLLVLFLLIILFEYVKE